MLSSTGYKAPGALSFGLAGLSLAPIADAFKSIKNNVAADEPPPSLMPFTESSIWTEWLLSGYMGNGAQKNELFRRSKCSV